MEPPTTSPDGGPGLAQLWHAHRAAVIAGAVLTILLQGIVVAFVIPTPKTWLINAFAAQLWLMVVLVPWTAHVGRCALSFLTRAGAIGDAFALALLFGVLTGRLRFWPAVKVFLLLEVVLLLLLGIFAVLRFATGWLLLAPAGTLLIGTLLVLATYVWPAHSPFDGPWGTLDLYSAVCDAGWTTIDGVGWHRVLGIFACAAGIAWATARLLGMPWIAQPLDDGRANPP